MAEGDPLSFWQKELGLENHEIVLEKIYPRQVFDEEVDRHKNPLLGVRLDGKKKAAIVHTRPLSEEDIIHEFLHIAHWDWDEKEIVAETNRLMGLI